jgi:gliding motility-associated-like protein
VPNAQITTNGARITWTNPGVPTTGMGIYVVLAGSPPPVAGTPPTYTTLAPPNSYTITTGLLADTTYDVYIQTICSVNSPSVWVTTPVTFTTLPTCPRPTALATANITTTSVRVSWTNPTGTAWQVLALPAGSPAPNAGTPGWVIATGGSPFIVTGLTPDTAYDFYVRSDCGAVNGISNWSLPTTATTLPTCPKPTALTIGTITDNSALAGWTNPTGTSWQVLVLPAGSAAPTAASTGWVVANTNTGFALTGLSAATCYDYYVRTDCGAVNGLSTWSGPRNFCTTICNPADQCLYTFTMTDSFGDGWNGATMQVRQNGILVATIGGTFTAGAGPVVVNVPLCSGVPFDLNWNAGGTFPGEVRVSITNIFAQVLYNMNVASAGLVGTVVYSDSRADCLFPKCLPPSNLSAVPSIFNAALDWTQANNNTAWSVYVVPTGGAAPTIGSTPTYPNVGAHPFTTPNTLAANTTYDYYVRSLCGTGTPGDWVGPFTFTTLPTCPQPTNLHYVATNFQAADLAWNEIGPATSWNIMVQTSGGPAPGPTSGCVVNTLPTDATPYNTLACFGALTPGFYEFYVRANCTGTDLSAWSGPINFYISAPLPACADVEIDVVTTSPGQIDFCPGDYCIDLSATYTDSKDTTDYSILGIPFAPPFPFTGGTQLNIATDDIWGPAFTLPFDFCFYGVNYPTIQVGSNGVLTFTPQTAPGNCPWAFTAQIPATNFPIRNAIYGVYQDINPSVSTAPIVHTINYQVLGTAPCRSFVVNYDNIAQFSCGVNVGLQTSQIVLYETSNIIEVYVQDRTACTTWNSGSGLIGLQNDLGTIAHVPPGRNTGPWNTQNEAWRFTPDGNSTVQFSWLRDGVVVSNSPTVNVCFNQDTNMTAQAVYTGCGGTVTTKTESILLNITTVNVQPIAPVFSCTSYALPALTVGNYFTLPGGPAGGGVQIPVGTQISTTQTIYVYAELTTGTAVCSDEESFVVTIDNQIVPTFATIPTLCFNSSAPALNTTSSNGLSGTWSPTSIDTSIIGPTNYTFTPDGTLPCAIPTTIVVTISNPILPNFAPIPSICAGTTVPSLGTIAPNGITGSWLPATIDNANTGSYVFTPDAGQCATTQTLNVNVTAPNINPAFAAIPDVCSGTVAPSLATTSPIGITGSWLPATIDNANTGSYVFTPDAGQCATTQTLNVNVTAPSINPSFVAIPDVCSGTVAPILATTSPTGITGSWSPTTIDNTASGTYEFTPNAGQCATPQTLGVLITPITQPNFADIAAFCSGATAPSLALISPNGVTGIWSPAIISNTTSGDYTFTPSGAQCASTKLLSVTVTPNTTPDFADVAPICSGASAPTLAGTSPNGVNGTWLPAIISNTADGSYEFTPSAGQCAVPQTLAVTVTPPINLLIDGGCDNGIYVLTVSSDSPNFDETTATFQWLDSSNAVVGTSASVVLTSTGTYTCNVTNLGCLSSTSTGDITSITCTIQKGISPRGTGIGDGKNDYLKLACKKLEIFNRYGMVVYSKNNYSNNWFGQSDSGSELPDGTYFYVVEQDNAPAQTGWIYINREQ